MTERSSLQSSLKEEGWSPQVRAIKAYNRRLLFTTLDTIEGEKTIVWSASLMERVSLFANTNDLNEHGVTVNYSIDKQLKTSTPNILFFIEKSLSEANKLINYLRNVNNEKALNHVFFIPEEWYAARQKLKDDEQIWKKLETVRALPLSWLPSEGDMLFLDDPTLPSRLLLNGDWTTLHRCACALFELETIIGRPLLIHTNGKWSQDVGNMIMKMRNNEERGGGLEIASASLPFTRLVLVDRWLDPLTPLLTPITYAGLLDEIFGIRLKDVITVSKSDFEDKDSPGSNREEKKHVPLDDDVFHRVKHLHLSELLNSITYLLSDVQKELQIDKDNMSIAEYALFVKKLPLMHLKKSRVSKHMRLAELVSAEMRGSLFEESEMEKELLVSRNGDRVEPLVERLIVSGESQSTSLRLVAIQSLAAEGLKSSVLQLYRKMIFHTYGMDALNKFIKMHKIGLIREKGSMKFLPSYISMPFAQHSKSFNLLPSDVEALGSSTDASYAYNYYAPLLVRIIEEGVKVKWMGWKTLGASYVDRKEDKRVLGDTVLFVVGGITRAEMAGLRCIPQIGLVTSSSILTRNSLVISLTNIL